MKPTTTLLICTQAIDTADPVLGFFHEWVKEFAKSFERITVIALNVGKYDLPENVTVHSLGKESGGNRLAYTLRFFKYIFSAEYDGVFVHMNPEYVILGGIVWRLRSKRISLWYNHESKNVRFLAAKLLAHRLFHTSPFAASSGNRKSKRMPVGVATDFFKNIKTRGQHENRNVIEVLSLGRIAPVKKIEVIWEAVRVLLQENIPILFRLIGGALPKDASYRKRFESEKNTQPFAGHVVVLPAELSRKNVMQFYNQADIFVNASPAGLFDKTVFEAMACEAIPIVSSKAFRGMLPDACFFKEGDSSDLAKQIKKIADMPSEQRSALGMSMRSIVESEHSLQKLSAMLAADFRQFL